MEAVTVITADIVRSRTAGDIALSLPGRLVELTHPLLITPFSMSRGDEIQAACRGSLQAPELVRQLRFACLPVRLRVGIGVGEVETGLGSANSWDMNGSAFVRARESLESLGKTPQAHTVVRSSSAGFDEIANALWALMDALQNRWTREQWDAVHYYERLGTYEAAGKALGIALQNVQKRCKAANWVAVRQAEEALRHLGRELMGGHPSPTRG